MFEKYLVDSALFEPSLLSEIKASDKSSRPHDGHDNGEERIPQRLANICPNCNKWPQTAKEMATYRQTFPPDSNGKVGPL